MSKLIVKEFVPGCDLEEVELEVEPLSLTVTDSAGHEEQFHLRGFFPTSIDGVAPFEHAVQQIAVLVEHTDGEEQEFYSWLIQMLAFYGIYPKLDPQRKRQFNIDTLDFSETLLELAACTGSESLPKPERLVRFGDDSTAPTSRLIEQAVYVQPELRIPLGQPHYVAFREQLLLEMRDTTKGIMEGLMNEALQHGRQWIESQGWPPDKRAKAIELLDSPEAWEENVQLQELIHRIQARLLKSAVKLEDHVSSKFTDLVVRARQLQQPVGCEVRDRQVQMLAEDGETFTSEYADCICRNFNVRTADALLDDVIRRYEEVFQIPHAHVEAVTDDLPKQTDGWLTFELEDIPRNADIATPFGPMLADFGENAPVELRQYLGFVAARHTEDIFEKWYYVGWVTVNLVNRNECIRLLQREAEGVFFEVVDNDAKQIYRKVRRQMTRPERRAFQLLYFRQPLFGYRVAVADPVLLSFFTGSDDETQGLILLVLVYKRRESGDQKELGKELERRWRAYLRFYPYWSDIIRDEEREAKRQAALRRRQRSLDEPTGFDENGKEVTLKDEIPDPRITPSDLFRALVTRSQGDLTELANKFCTARQASYILRFVEGRTEVEIAREDGVSQQAVSKGIRAGLRRIQKGLAREGLLKVA